MNVKLVCRLFMHFVVALGRKEIWIGTGEEWTTNRRTHWTETELNWTELVNRVNSGPERHSIIINNNREHNKRRSSDPSDLSASQKTRSRSHQVAKSIWAISDADVKNRFHLPCTRWPFDGHECESVSKADRAIEREGEENWKMIWIVFADATQQQLPTPSPPAARATAAHAPPPRGQRLKPHLKLAKLLDCQLAAAACSFPKPTRAAATACIVVVVVVAVVVSLWAPYRCHNQKRYLVANSRIISSAPKCLLLGRLQVDLRLPGNQHVQHCQLATSNSQLKLEFHSLPHLLSAVRW